MIYWTEIETTMARRAAVQIRVAENDSETYTDSTTTSYNYKLSEQM